MKKIVLAILATCFMVSGFALPEVTHAQTTAAPLAAEVSQNYQSRISYSWGTATTYQRSQISSLISVLREMDKGIPITQGINIIGGFIPNKFYTSKNNAYYLQIIEAIKIQNNKTKRGVVLNLTFDGGYWVSTPPR
ncbi:hypothetical protein [Enterococcus rivorum]|uniref:Uncharacterized protein n=1 Tax=Enterococcus rivorum TaxID=762845 RepID=A0A1E5KUB2_9ENTE|nr:hypothetical protein [Enterococcus rivorum]MBP2098952.1 putative Zn-dependent protease [Enterococcus rivorum]OEH81451.1 hypothetical protein BCR26_04180 [Enterococcus rivorum]